MGKVGPRDPGLEEDQGLFATLHARVSYVGVPAAVFKIMDVGRGTFKAKSDLRHPCRLLLVNVEDRNFFWECVGETNFTLTSIKNGMEELVFITRRGKVTGFCCALRCGRQHRFFSQLWSVDSLFKYCYQRVDSRCDCGKTLGLWPSFAVSKRVYAK